MITVLEGERRAIRTALGFFEQQTGKGVPIYTDFDAGKWEQYEKCRLFLSEAFEWYDSRTHTSRKNNLFCYFAGQAKERGVDIFLSAPSFDMVEKRIRELTDQRGVCFFSRHHNKLYVHLLEPTTASFGTVVDGWQSKAAGIDTYEIDPICQLLPQKYVKEAKDDRAG